MIIDKRTPTADELQLRLIAAGGLAVFDKDARDDDNTITRNLQPPEGVTILQDFTKRLAEFRQCLNDMAIPRLREAFRQRAEAVNKDFKECKQVEDFVRAYRTLPYDNKMRRMINLLCNEMWGKECIGAIEEIVMAKLKILYKNELVNPK